MAKVTSKLQVTVPKAIAERYSIHPGDDIEWLPADDVIRVVPKSKPAPLTCEAKLHLFDQATERHRGRTRSLRTNPPKNRGWKREDLYGRGRSH
jgi:AbrB family looped-hinge helix DNA binding protein